MTMSVPNLSPVTSRLYSFWLGAALLLLVNLACGRAGETETTEKFGFDGDTSEVAGSITSQSGGQSDMQGWVLALVDRDSGISRVAEVDAAGLYRFFKVPVSSVYTLVLLTPDYVVSSVLSMPSTVQNTIRQFFQLQAVTLPRIINQGDIIVFENLNNISVVGDLAADADGDAVPDGVAGFGLTSMNGPAFALSDLDGDGIVDEQDADIDGDGIANWFDPDDDGDGVLDVVDLDANGNLIPDINEQKTDVFFNQGLEWLSVGYEQTPEGSSTKSTLKFVAKMNTAFASPIAIQVRGSPGLLGSAIVEYVDSETLEESSQAFLDRRLFDDGANEDGSPNDYVFARRVTLAENAKPRPNQVFFIQLAYGSETAPWFVEFPYTMPNVKSRAITARFDKSTRTVNLVGNPFGTLQEYMWTVSVFNAEGLLVDASPPILGVQSKTRVMKEHLVEAGDHTFRVVAQLLDRVPGYPSFKVSSPEYPLE